MHNFCEQMKEFCHIEKGSLVTSHHPPSYRLLDTVFFKINKKKGSLYIPYMYLKTEHISIDHIRNQDGGARETERDAQTDQLPLLPPPTGGGDQRPPPSISDVRLPWPH